MNPLIRVVWVLPLVVSVDMPREAPGLLLQLRIQEVHQLLAIGGFPSGIEIDSASPDGQRLCPFLGPWFLEFGYPGRPGGSGRSAHSSAETLSAFVCGSSSRSSLPALVDGRRNPGFGHFPAGGAFFPGRISNPFQERKGEIGASFSAG